MELSRTSNETAEWPDHRVGVSLSAKEDAPSISTPGHGGKSQFPNISPQEEYKQESWTFPHEMGCFYGNSSGCICNYFNEPSPVLLNNWSFTKGPLHSTFGTITMNGTSCLLVFCEIACPVAVARAKISRPQWNENNDYEFEPVPPVSVSTTKIWL